MARTRNRFVIAGVALAASLVLVPAAAACPTTETAEVFAAAGDNGAYSVLPGATFDSVVPWSSTDTATVATEGNPNGSTSASLKLANAGSVTTAPICINRYEPRLRFAARAPVDKSHVKVAVLWTDVDGRAKQTQIADYDSNKYPAWGVSASLSFKDAVPREAGDRWVRLKIWSDAPDGVWLLDDISVAVSEAPLCADMEASQVFAQWGDYAYYAPLPGGLFETSDTWWTTGGSLLPGGDPFGIGAGSTSALQLPGRATTLSPWICINRYYPHVRFAARAPLGGSHLKVYVRWIAVDGKLYETKIADLDPNKFAAWALSGEVSLRDAVPDDEAVRDVRLRFNVDGDNGHWLIDDVYIDPYKRG